ncbi:MAG: TonB-dependent receptor [Alphaproteobacteria bacterium]
MLKSNGVKVSVLALMVGLSAPTFAQDAPSADATASANAGTPEGVTEEPAAKNLQLEEIVVTAQKRAENIQDVPVSMSAVTGDSLKERGIDNFDSMANYTPNVNITSGNGSAFVRIRGLGSMANDGFEDSVGFYIDDIYYGRSVYMGQAFLDLDRIEVLRGPQGTLFGKNTVAGAINMHTANPSNEWEFGGDVTYGELNNQSASLIVNVPLFNDDIGLRAAGTFQERDGWYYNVQNDDEERNVDRINLRGKIGWDITADWDLIAGYSYAVYKDNGPGFELYDANEPTQTLNGLINSEVDFELNRRGGTDTDALTDITTKTWTLHSNLDVGEHSFVLAAGYSDYHHIVNFDADGGAFPMLTWNNEDNYDQTSVELRVVSPPGQFEYVAGLHYFANTYDGGTDFRVGNFTGPTNTILGIVLPPAADALLGQTLVDLLGGTLTLDQVLSQNLSDRLDQTFVQDTVSYAAFGQVTGYFFDDWQLVLGLRASYEEKEALMSQQYENTGILLQAALGITEYVINVSRDETQFAPKVSLKYEIRDNLNAYATIAKGFKAGGFNPFAETPDRTEFESEESTTFEGGLKGRYWDGRISANLSLFHTIFDNLQTSVVGGTGSTFIVDNAASATSQGFEFDATVLLAEWLTSTISVGWTDATYDEYPNAPCITEENSLGGFVSDPNSCDASGKPLTEAPEWNAALGGNITLPLDMLGTVSGSNIVFILGADAIYRGETFMNLDYDPASFQEAYWRFDARLGLADMDGTWAFMVTGQNLTDEEYLTLSVDAPVQAGSHIGTLGDPRYINATFRFFF